MSLTVLPSLCSVSMPARVMCGLAALDRSALHRSGAARTSEAQTHPFCACLVQVQLCTAARRSASWKPCCVCLMCPATDRQTDRPTASKPLLQLTPVQRKRKKHLTCHCIQRLLSTLHMTYSSKSCLGPPQIGHSMTAQSQPTHVPRKDQKVKLVAYHAGGVLRGRASCCVTSIQP